MAFSGAASFFNLRRDPYAVSNGPGVDSFTASSSAEAAASNSPSQQVELLQKILSRLNEMDDKWSLMKNTLDEQTVKIERHAEELTRLEALVKEEAATTRDHDENFQILQKKRMGEIIHTVWGLMAKAKQWEFYSGVTQALQEGADLVRDDSDDQEPQRNDAAAFPTPSISPESSMDASCGVGLDLAPPQTYWDYEPQDEEQDRTPTIQDDLESDVLGLHDGAFAIDTRLSTVSTEEPQVVEPDWQLTPELTDLDEKILDEISQSNHEEGFSHGSDLDYMAVAPTTVVPSWLHDDVREVSPLSPDPEVRDLSPLSPIPSDSEEPCAKEKLAPVPVKRERKAASAPKAKKRTAVATAAAKKVRGKAPPRPYRTFKGWPVKTRWRKANMFIQCDVCYFWYHWGCVGVTSNTPKKLVANGDDRDQQSKPDELWSCPPCTAVYKSSPKKFGKNLPKSNPQQDHVACARTDCKKLNQDNDEVYVVNKLVGKWWNRDDGSDAEYLVLWHGYSINETTWSNKQDLSEDLIAACEKEAKKVKIQRREKMWLLPEAAHLNF